MARAPRRSSARPASSTRKSRSARASRPPPCARFPARAPLRRCSSGENSSAARTSPRNAPRATRGRSGKECHGTTTENHMTPPPKVDVAATGAGTAGLAAYRAARAAGVRAVLIEGGTYGTTCARVGCMPSKLIIAAAEAAHAIGRARGFGVHIDGKLRIDGREVMARVKRERDRFVGFVIEGVEAMPEADHVRGYAKFVDRNTLQVGERRIEARAIVIATGSRPAIPPILDAIGDRLVVNDDVFDWDDLPRSVAVFGPGVIGLELGQALARLGVRVVVLGRGGRLGPITDPYVQHAATGAFSADFTLDTNAHVSPVERIR